MADDEIISTIRRYLLDKVLSNPDLELRDDTPLVSGGLVDSAALMDLALYLEQTYRIKLPEDAFSLENMDTLQALAKLVRRVAALDGKVSQ